MGQPYRCDVCRAELARCPQCRARRSTARAARRAARRDEGRCSECDAPAEPGLTLCAHHSACNTARSRLSHDRARRRAGAPTRRKAS